MNAEKPTVRGAGGDGEKKPTIALRAVSRWYGEVLGINKVSVDIAPGITGLVGPNGSGKSTLMNIICGLLRPSQGTARIFGEEVWNNYELRRRVGYCTQVDKFYEKLSGFQFLYSLLLLHARGKAWAEQAARDALAQVSMSEHAGRTLATYSKGMRQRIKIALSLAHDPDILVLDEPFNGLDPVGRSEMMTLLADQARLGRTIVLSSHILHEIERMTENILMMSNGYVLAEGKVQSVRDALRQHPFKVFIRCDAARALAAEMLTQDSILKVEMEGDNALTLSTTDPDKFYLRLNDVIIEREIDVEVVTLADENVQSIYQYLSGREHH